MVDGGREAREGGADGGPEGWRSEGAGLVGAVAPVAVRWIVPGRVGIAVRVGVVRVRRVSVVWTDDREAEREEGMEAVTVAEEEAVVAEVVDASWEATELATAELTTGEVPRSEAPTTKLPTTEAADLPAPETPDVATAELPAAAPDVPTEAADLPAHETTTPDVPAAKAPATVPPSKGKRGAAAQCQREDDGAAERGEVTTERNERPTDRRELHGGSLVASSGLVKGKCTVSAGRDGPPLQPQGRRAPGGCARSWRAAARAMAFGGDIMLITAGPDGIPVAERRT